MTGDAPLSSKELCTHIDKVCGLVDRFERWNGYECPYCEIERLQRERDKFKLWYELHADKTIERAAAEPPVVNQSLTTAELDEREDPCHPAYVGPLEPAAPVAWVPVHPRNGPLWSMTMRAENRDVLPHYDLMPLYGTAQPSKSGEWQPIETAPKDGTQILTVVAGWQPGIYQWLAFEEGGGRWTPDPECFLAEEHLREWLDGTTYEPTHWMPLPTSPTKCGAP